MHISESISEDDNVRMVLLKKHLLEVDVWNKKAQNYIESSPIGIRLSSVIESHHPDLQAFYDDLFQLISEEFESEREEYEYLTERKMELLRTLSDSDDTSV